MEEPLSKEELRRINNKLVEITLSTDKMMDERNKIYKTIKEIKEILNKK